MLIEKWLTTFGRYVMLMGRTFSRPERLRMFLKQYVKEMAQLGVDSIGIVLLISFFIGGIVLLISFFIGAVICIQMKLNIQSPWMPRWVSGYTTREIMLLEFSSSIMCLILAGKGGSNIASEIGTMRVTQQIDALEIMGINSASYLILPKIMGLITIMPCLVVFFLLCDGYRGRLCHRVYRPYHDARRPHDWSPAQLQLLVRLDVDHQESLLRLHHLQCPCLLRLLRRGRLCRCG